MVQTFEERGIIVLKTVDRLFFTGLFVKNENNLSKKSIFDFQNQASNKWIISKLGKLTHTGKR